VRIGFDCQIAHNTGSFGSPTWVDWKNVKDVTLNMEADDADASTRKSRIKTSLAGMIGASVDFQSNWDTTDTVFAAILAAFLAGTTVDLAVLDGGSAEAGSQGLHAEFCVLKCSEAQPLNGVTQADISIKPAQTDNPPAWITISGS
jgi:hypothetical protein